jgi:hypothetical protein
MPASRPPQRPPASILGYAGTGAHGNNSPRHTVRTATRRHSVTTTVVSPSRQGPLLHSPRLDRQTQLTQLRVCGIHPTNTTDATHTGGRAAGGCLPVSADVVEGRSRAAGLFLTGSGAPRGVRRRPAPVDAPPVLCGDVDQVAPPCHDLGVPQGGPAGRVPRAPRGGVLFLPSDPTGS